MASADLLLHPVRLRVVKAFLGDRALTTAQLAAELDDVPVGSLYRHIALLTREGVLQVVAERRVRGAVERTYTLRLAAAQMQAAEVAEMTPDDHAHAFVAYVAGMLGDFDRYVTSETFDPIRDGATYQVAGMWLSDAEYAEFLRALSAVALPLLANPPARGRRRRLLYNVLLPASEPGGPPFARTSSKPTHPATAKTATTATAQAAVATTATAGAATARPASDKRATQKAKPSRPPPSSKPAKPAVPTAKWARKNKDTGRR